MTVGRKILFTGSVLCGTAKLHIHPEEIENAKKSSSRGALRCEIRSGTNKTQVGRTQVGRRYKTTIDCSTACIVETGTEAGPEHAAKAASRAGLYTPGIVKNFGLSIPFALETEQRENARKVNHFIMFAYKKQAEKDFQDYKDMGY